MAEHKALLRLIYQIHRPRELYHRISCCADGDAALTPRISQIFRDRQMTLDQPQPLQLDL